MIGITPRQSWMLGCALSIAMLAGAFVALPYGKMHQAGNIPPFLAGAGLMLAAFAGAMMAGRKCLLCTESDRDSVSHTDADSGSGTRQRHPSFPIPLPLIAIAAVAIRVVLLFQAPGDDLYRYIWEGKLLLAQKSPYLHAPDSAGLVPLRDANWESVEHKSVSAIYPPMAQWCFAALHAIAPTILCYKLAFAAADLATGWLLWRRFGGAASLLYLWNPLVIYSFAGGGHYDSLFILPLVAGWLAWMREKTVAGVLWIGVAVAMKWLALPILGWAVWQVMRKRGLVAALPAGALALLVGMAPFAGCWLALLVWTGEWSWQLHPRAFTEVARSAELVPSLVVVFWPDAAQGNQWILPLMAMAWAVVILSCNRITTAMEWIFFTTLILSPVVHAWYFTWLIPCAVASRNLGAILVSGSAFAYFLIHHRLSADWELKWTFTPTELVIIWLPYVTGFLWTYLRRQSPDSPSPAADTTDDNRLPLS
ncbi:hypothetical protein DB346_10145 [Verrucomicrobia bacterium LW23]|nr:hypothetical protein DB346_10145 [Verrucomicrobia bacterium LW23]